MYRYVGTNWRILAAVTEKLCWFWINVFSHTHKCFKSTDFISISYTNYKQLTLNTICCCSQVITKWLSFSFVCSGKEQIKHPYNKVSTIQSLILPPTLLSVQLPASLQYFYHPAPVWPQYKKVAPVFLTTVCVPPVPPPPPQQVFGYYILPQPPPQFILPQATLQPWGAVKG